MLAESRQTILTRSSALRGRLRARNAAEPKIGERAFDALLSAADPRADYIRSALSLRSGQVAAI